MKSTNAMRNFRLLQPNWKIGSPNELRKGKKPTQESIKKQVASMLSGQCMKKLIETDASKKKDILVLTYQLKSESYADLADAYRGKKISS